MSDFDKEAEREKLRQRFEAEEEDREVTARMSELLLQGATMTNRHCDTCHSPIFTYQGQSFCPTCQVEVGDSGGEAANADGAAADTDQASSEPATDAGSGPDSAIADDSRSATRIEVDDPGTANGADPGSGAPSEPEAAASPVAPSEQAPTSESTASAPTPDLVSTTEQARGSTPAAATSQADTSGDVDLAAAQTSLSRTLTQLSHKAERSDDLSRTRDYLLAAQEAAEALSALKQARR